MSSLGLLSVASLYSCRSEAASRELPEAPGSLCSVRWSSSPAPASEGAAEEGMRERQRGDDGA